MCSHRRDKKLAICGYIKKELWLWLKPSFFDEFGNGGECWIVRYVNHHHGYIIDGDRYAFIMRGKGNMIPMNAPFKQFFYDRFTV